MKIILKTEKDKLEFQLQFYLSQLKKSKTQKDYKKYKELVILYQKMILKLK